MKIIFYLDYIYLGDASYFGVAERSEDKSRSGRSVS